MTWRKAPESLVTAFLEALPEDPRAERRKMFGYPCCFVNGNLSTGLHQDDLILRLSEADRAELSALGAQPFEPMAGRVMKAYLVAPEEVVASDRLLAEWIGRAFTYALTLPPKSRSKKRAAKATKPKAPRKAPRKAPASKASGSRKGPWKRARG